MEGRRREWTQHPIHFRVAMRPIRIGNDGRRATDTFEYGVTHAEKRVQNIVIIVMVLEAHICALLRDNNKFNSEQYYLFHQRKQGTFHHLFTNVVDFI